MTSKLQRRNFSSNPDSYLSPPSDDEPNEAELERQEIMQYLREDDEVDQFMANR